MQQRARDVRRRQRHQRYARAGLSSGPDGSGEESEWSAERVGGGAKTRSTRTVRMSRRELMKARLTGKMAGFEVLAIRERKPDPKPIRKGQLESTLQEDSHVGRMHHQSENKNMI